ncbi:putative phage abortive infection protein [Pseudooceanicola sp.]|uniref:putative phage abortive infection protein n=1 Tax=Pseudooceanicola sp. TaxID=1914328 RepID=UPI0040587247
MSIDPAIKLALAFTVLLLTGIFLFSFTPGCAGGTDCDRSGWSYFLEASPNEVGDALAGVATALAFFWLITTVHLQSKELKEQRNEFHEMNIRLGSQQFESAFNDLLSSFIVVREALKLEHLRGEKVTGADALHELAESLMYALSHQGDRPIPIEYLEDRYGEYWIHHGRKLAPYFRYLFNLYRFIDESSHRQVYHARILRSLLSDGELVLLLYNSKTKRGKKFLYFMEKYSILDNLELTTLKHGPDIVLVPRSVFGDNLELLEAWDDGVERWGQQV